MRHRIVSGLLLLAGLTFAGAADTAKAPVMAPGFSLAGPHGTVTLDSLRGRVVWVDFWASWCEPCRHSFAWMDSLERRYGPRGFAVVAIGLDKDDDHADAFLAEHRPSFRVAYDPTGATAERWGVAAMPTSFLVAPDGRIVMTHAGFDPRQTAKLEHAIEEALPR